MFTYRLLALTAAVLATASAASAQNTGLLGPAPGATVLPPAGAPHAFTPAPISTLSPGAVAPAGRAGGAADAGPINATPFSSDLSTVLTGTQTSRALNDANPGRDPAAAAQAK